MAAVEPRESCDTGHGWPAELWLKRVGGLFERIWAFQNVELAAWRAERGKRYRPDVLAFNFRREDELHRLSDELRTGSWRPQPHRHFRIYEPKARWISAAPYRDRVVHHALCNVMGPVLDQRLIFDCWANRVGKGTHRAVVRFQRFARRHRFALKMDIQKYFPSIDHAILKGQLARVLKDPEVLALTTAVIDHGEVPEPHHRHFPGDDLFTPYERPKGLPIGNLTSQTWANTYLSGFDHWVKQELPVGGYVRFVDDFVLLHDSKTVLARVALDVHEALRELRLVAHPAKTVIRRTDEGMPFLGYVVWPDRIRVRGQTVRRFRRRLRARRARDPERAQRSLAAWRGHVAVVGTWRKTAPWRDAS